MTRKLPVELDSEEISMMHKAFITYLNQPGISHYDMDVIERINKKINPPANGILWKLQLKENDEVAMVQEKDQGERYRAWWQQTSYEANE